jgi:transcriptional regulator with XRE-family HTH domain
MLQELMSKYSTRTLSAGLSVSPMTISRWRNGGTPNLKHLDGLCSLFSVQPSVFFPIARNKKIPECLEGLDFAASLQALMMHANIYNYQLARDLEVSPATVAIWLSGRTLPNFEKFEEILVYFNVAPEAFCETVYT